jgi:hypothetical protein
MVRTKVVHPGLNPLTGKVVHSLRSTIVTVEGPLLERARTDTIFPPDETM